MSVEQTGSSSGKMQWVAIIFTAIGLMASIHFHIHSLQTARMENELFSYLQLDKQYSKLLYTLIENNADAFTNLDDSSFKTNKFIMYELFDLFATVESLRPYYHELNIWPNWQKRMEFLFSKPAIQLAWQKHQKSAHHIYQPGFIQHVDHIIASTPLLPEEIAPTHQQKNL